MTIIDLPGTHSSERCKAAIRKLSPSVDACCDEFGEDATLQALFSVLANRTADRAPESVFQDILRTVSRMLPSLYAAKTKCRIAAKAGDRPQ